MEKYGKVIGFDTSEQQLEAARATWASSPESKSSSAEVIFKKGNSERILLEDASVDLITVAQALHWFDLNLFYPEAHRVLNEKGTLAIWGYDKPIIEGFLHVMCYLYMLWLYR